MTKNDTGVGGKAFRKARKTAEGYAGNKDRVKNLLEKGLKKAEKKEGGLKAVWEDLMTFFRLLRAWYKKEYTEVPWNTIILIIAAILYFLMPLDLIPDFIPIAGYVDDTAVIMWVTRKIHDDLVDFCAWEKQQ